MLGSREELVDILGRVARQDRAAFDALYRATSAKLYGVILGIVAQRSHADEILQEVFVRIWDRAPHFDPARASPITWMATIARNRAIDEIRKRGTLPVSHMPEDFDPAAEETHPLAGQERSDELKALLRCLDQLDSEKREVILLAYYRGLSRDALADRFDKPVATIKTWLHRSLTQLRVCLSR